MTPDSVFFHRSNAMPEDINPKFGQPGDSLDLPSVDKDADTHKVLLVDDNTDLLEMTAEQFQDLGFEVLIASNGHEALEILQQVRGIDVLMTDVVMPGMNGMQLGYEARKLLPLIKVILVSGYPNLATESNQDNLNDFSFLQKPYRMKDVVRVLTKLN